MALNSLLTLTIEVSHLGHVAGVTNVIKTVLNVVLEHPLLQGAAAKILKSRRTVRPLLIAPAKVNEAGSGDLTSSS